MPEFDDIPVIDIQIESRKIEYHPKKLSKEFLFMVSPWLHTINGYEGYGPLGLYIKHRDSKKPERYVTPLLERIRRRERFNIKLGIRKLKKRLYDKKIRG